MTQDRTTSGLSQRDIKQFWDDGFLAIDDVFSAEEIEGFNQACTAPEDQEWKKSEETIHSMSITQRHPSFLALAKDWRIVSFLTSLIGEDIQLHHSKLAAQPAQKGKGGYGWHQDFPYFPHTNTDLVAVMVMLDDATTENGCMQMLRGSHKLGPLNHMSLNGLFATTCQENDRWENNPENIISITPRAGGMSIHHCLTLHGSGPNTSGKPRRGMVFQYRADDAYQLAGALWEDSGLYICGERREYIRCDAGVLRIPKSDGVPGRPFGDAWNQEREFAQQENEKNGLSYL